MSFFDNLKQQTAQSVGQTVMKDIILDHLINRSDQKQIRYTLICPSCTKEWTSTQVDLEKAAAEAEVCFCVCQLCGRLVCASCMTSVGEIKMCRNCADRMN